MDRAEGRLLLRCWREEGAPRSPIANNGKSIGPERGFGYVMGHVLDEAVLVLKSCIGNRSLGWDLLPLGSAAHASKYEENLERLMKSLRKDYDVPNVNFVLATGCGNPGREGLGLKIAEAQLALGDAKKSPKFQGNVKAVASRYLWRDAADTPKIQGYHYHRNAETYLEVGHCLGWATVKLLQK